MYILLIVQYKGVSIKNLNIFLSPKKAYKLFIINIQFFWKCYFCKRQTNWKDIIEKARKEMNSFISVQTVRTNKQKNHTF